MMTTKLNGKTSDLRKNNGCTRRILCAILMLLCTVFLSAAVCGAALMGSTPAQLQFSVGQNGALTVRNDAVQEQTFTFIFAVTDADGRLTALRVDDNKTLGEGASAALSVKPGEDAVLTLNEEGGAVLLGTLYSFDEDLSPVAEPVKVYTTPVTCFIDASSLFA